MQHPGREWGWVLGIAWIAAWSSITLLFDGKLAHSVFKQLQALSFQAVEGTIVESQVADNDNREAPTYQPQIRYDYVVEGRHFTGSIYRHGFSTGDRRAVEKVVEAYPANSHVTVFFNPADPDEALLSPGLSTDGFFFLLCMTPFNIIVLASWATAVGVLRGWTRITPDTLRVSDRGTELRIRPPRLAAIAASAAVAFVTSFAAVFILAFTVGASPPAALTAVAWGIVLALSALAYVFVDASDELVIDRVRGTLTLPRGASASRDLIALADVAEIRLSDERRRDSNGNAREYSCLIRWASAAGKDFEARWLEQSDRPSAEQLVEWLRNRCFPT